MKMGEARNRRDNDYEWCGKDGEQFDEIIAHMLEGSNDRKSLSAPSSNRRSVTIARTAGIISRLRVLNQAAGFVAIKSYSATALGMASSIAMAFSPLLSVSE